MYEKVSDIKGAFEKRVLKSTLLEHFEAVVQGIAFIN